MAAIDFPFFPALEFIYLRLAREQSPISWVIVGSSSLVLNGIKIEANDLDIATSSDGAYIFANIFNKYQEKPVTFGETEFFKSHYGTFNIKDTRVEIMGDLHECRSSQWFSRSRRWENPVYIMIRDMQIPVTSLEDQLESYRESSRPKDQLKLQRIQQFLNYKV